MIFSIVGLLVFVFVIGSIVYLVMRRRSANEGATIYQALMVYFYTMISASIITFAIGAGYLLTAAFSSVYNDWPISEEVTLGVTLLATGAVICLLHVFGKRAFEKREGRVLPAIKRVYLFFMLAVFSLGGLVALPMAIYETARYYVEGEMYWGDPSAQIASAVIIVPLWVYYLIRVLRETRAAKKEPFEDVTGGESR